MFTVPLPLYHWRSYSPGALIDRSHRQQRGQVAYTKLIGDMPYRMALSSPYHNGSNIFYLTAIRATFCRNSLRHRGERLPLATLSFPLFSL